MTTLPDSGMIFSRTEHLVGLQRMQRRARAKLVGYRFSKFFLVGLVSLSLIGAGTLSAFAGSSHHPMNVHKTVKAIAGNKTHIGSSHSNAKVSNNNSVHIAGSGGGGHVMVTNRGNNGNNHNNKKKVVRKKVVKKIVRKNIDVSNTTNTTVNKIIKYYPSPAPSQPDYCSSGCEQDYTPPSYDYSPSYPSYPPYDHGKNPCVDSCYDKNPCDETCYRYPSKQLYILNNNTNTNKNYNANTYHPLSDWADDYSSNQ